jgi:hypothetical protein
MAFKVKQRDEVDENLPEISHEDRLLTARKKRVVENDRVTRESIRQAIDHHREVMDTGTQEERINHYSAMHVQREVGGLLIGHGFIEEKRRISAGESSYASLNELFEQNADVLPFGRATLYQYIKIAEAVPIDYFEKMTVKKAIAVSQVRDDKKREQLIKTVIEKKLDDSETKSLIENFFEREKEKNRVKKEAVIEEAKEEVKVLVIGDGSPTDVILRVNRKYKDAVKNVLSAEIDRMKPRILAEYNRLTGK